MAERRRDPAATTIGLFTFIGGVGLIVATFVLAQALFSLDPADALNVQKGKPLDLNGVLIAGVGILMKILLLVVMAGIGSAVASRGIKLYTQGGAPPAKDDAKG